MSGYQTFGYSRQACSFNHPPFTSDANSVASNSLSIDVFGGRQGREVKYCCLWFLPCKGSLGSIVSELELLVPMNSLAVVVSQGFSDCSSLSFLSQAGTAQLMDPTPLLEGFTLQLSYKETLHYILFKCPICFVVETCTHQAKHIAASRRCFISPRRNVAYLDSQLYC